jgi:hypothetical protein
MRIKRFNENMELILELAQMTSENDFFRQKYGKIYIKGGGDNNGGQKEHDPPHFHLEFNEGKEIRIIIPNFIFDELKSLDTELNSKIIKDIRKWFELKHKTAKLYNNYDMLKIQWNELNYGDENVSKFTV